MILVFVYLGPMRVFHLRYARGFIFANVQIIFLRGVFKAPEIEETSIKRVVHLSTSIVPCRGGKRFLNGRVSERTIAGVSLCFSMRFSLSNLSHGVVSSGVAVFVFFSKVVFGRCFEDP